ncbi:copper amine oxidase [Flindersiella endophytica]
MRYRGIGVVLLALAVLATLVGVANTQAQAAETLLPCSNAYRIDRKLPNGARWQMCWQLRQEEGLTLSHVTYTPRGGVPQLVLANAGIAALHVPYDQGQPRFNDIGGLGEVIGLTKTDCPGGEIRAHHGVRAVCLITNKRGLAYRDQDWDWDEETEEPQVTDKALQGNDFAVFAISQIGWYTYVTEYRFSDDGTITPRLGATGSLPGDSIEVEDRKQAWPIGVRSSRFSPNHSHLAYWRLDFDVNGPKDDVVEQYDFTGNGTRKISMHRKVYGKEGAATIQPMRWWRVVDPKQRNSDLHAKSWEIVNDQSSQVRGPAAESWSHNDMYVTQRKKCETLVEDNGGESPNCATSVDKFVNGERVTDPVLWVGVSFHHVPRDEDEDPMPMHWQGFSIVPRDVTASSPLPGSRPTAGTLSHQHN